MKKFFSNLFKRKFKYRVILKSGASFTFKAADLTVSFKTDSMQLSKYSFEDDATGEIPFHCSPLEIAAIVKL